MRSHPRIQPRFLAFMLWDGQSEISERRAKAMIEDEKRSADFFEFIRQMMAAAARAERGCHLVTGIGSPYSQIVDHEDFTAFIFERVEAKDRTDIAAQ